MLRIDVVNGEFTRRIRTAKQSESDENCYDIIRKVSWENLTLSGKGKKWRENN